MFIIESKRSRSAFTLVEFMVALSIGFMALAGTAALSIYTARSFAAMGNYMELDKNSRSALDRMTQLVREADGVISYSQHNILLSYHGTNLSFVYTPDAKTLNLINTNGATERLLDDCTYFDFQIFQRNSVAGTYDQYPATLDGSAAKIVQVSWICTKTLIGSLINSESVQSAKIVIRKQ
jgi:Tfp pilus assembly protein PilW